MTFSGREDEVNLKELMTRFDGEAAVRQLPAPLADSILHWEERHTDVEAWVSASLKR